MHTNKMWDFTVLRGSLGTLFLMCKDLWLFYTYKLKNGPWKSIKAYFINSYKTNINNIKIIYNIMYNKLILTYVH
jgi:hypothetical protein